VRAATRVTAHRRTRPQRAHDADAPDRLTASTSRPARGGGEVFTVEAFQQVNNVLLEQSKSPFANPRNVAAGSLR
jgi:NAD-dependent DNA ligase